MKMGFLGAAAAGVIAGAFATSVFAGDGDAGLKGAPAAPSPSPWETFSKQFDLDKDGRVSWTEYQQVVTGFASLDTNHDGTIDKDEFEKVPHAGLFALGGFDVGANGAGVPLWGGVLGGEGEGKCEGGITVLGGGTSASVDLGDAGPWMTIGILGKAADTNHDDSLTRAEWDAFVAKLPKDANGAIAGSAFKEFLPENVPAMFADVLPTLLDRDKDGKLTAADLTALFEAADTDKDGVISQKDSPKISIQILGGEEK